MRDTDPQEYRGGMLRVSAALLHRLLQLPDDWKVLRVQPPSLPTYDDAITIVVTGPGLPMVSPNQLLPELIGTWTQHADGTVTVSFAPSGQADRWR